MRPVSYRWQGFLVAASAARFHDLQRTGGLEFPCASVSAGEFMIRGDAADASADLDGPAVVRGSERASGDDHRLVDDLTASPRERSPAAC
jgi:hypothetical protein